MNEGFDRREADTARTRERPDGLLATRPDRIAFWAFVLAVVAMVMAAASAHAGSGGLSATSGGGTTAPSPTNRRYAKIYDGFTRHDHRWARKTSM